MWARWVACEWQTFLLNDEIHSWVFPAFLLIENFYHVIERSLLSFSFQIVSSQASPLDHFNEWIRFTTTEWAKKDFIFINLFCLNACLKFSMNNEHQRNELFSLHSSRTLINAFHCDWQSGTTTMKIRSRFVVLGGGKLSAFSFRSWKNCWRNYFTSKAAETENYILEQNYPRRSIWTLVWLGSLKRKVVEK